MKLLNSTARLLAIIATAGLIAAPIASADQGRRGNGAHDNSRSNHRAHRDNRRHNTHNQRRNNHVRRDQRRRQNARRNQHSYNNHYRRRPRHVYRSHNRRHAYHAPRRGYAYPYGGNSVTFSYSTGPSYYNQGYAPRYSIGNRYGYHPRTVYVSDYGRYGLYAPPRGYHWVHDDDRGDAILASVATGAIIGLVIGAIAYD